MEGVAFCATSLFNFVRNLTSNLQFLTVECALSIPLTIFVIVSNTSITVITILTFSLLVYFVLILDLSLKLWYKDEDFWHLSEDFRREFFIMKASINISSFGLLAIIVECSSWSWYVGEHDDDWLTNTFYYNHYGDIARSDYRKYCKATALDIIYLKVAYQGTMLLIKIVAEIFNGKLHQFVIQLVNNIFFLWLRLMSLLYCLGSFCYVNRSYLADLVINRNTVMGRGSVFAIGYSVMLTVSVWTVSFILLMLHSVEFLHYDRIAENVMCDRDYMLFSQDHLLDCVYSLEGVSAKNSAASVKTVTPKGSEKSASSGSTKYRSVSLKSNPMVALRRTESKGALARSPSKGSGKGSSVGSFKSSSPSAAAAAASVPAASKKRSGHADMEMMDIYPDIERADML